MKSIEKTIKLIEIMKTKNNGIGINDLSKICNMPISTTHRILSVLEKHGYIIQSNDTKKYKLGLKFLEISRHILESLDLRKQAAPFLTDLMLKTNETVHLSILDENEIVFIDRVESQQSIRAISNIGMRAYPHLVASGKAILAFLPENELKTILSKIKFEEWLPNSIKDVETLIKELESVKMLGFAIDDEEHQKGGRCVAAPIFNYNGRVIAAVSVSGPSSRLPIALLKNEFSKYVINTANEISYSLGYTPK